LFDCVSIAQIVAVETKVLILTTISKKELAISHFWFPTADWPMNRWAASLIYLSMKASVNWNYRWTLLWTNTNRLVVDRGLPLLLQLPLFRFGARHRL